jgi:glucose/arabinose dehydrogenase
MAAASLLLAVSSARAVDLPPNFVVENVTPSATWTTPVGMAFLPGGRMLVAEKRGRVYSVTSGIKSANPMIAIENEVLNTGDRGLLGIAVDPNYVANHYVYLLYTVDPDSNGNDNNDDAFARLTRYTVSFSDSNVLDPASRTILMGANWTQGPVSCSQSHTIGTLRFGEDGSLLVGAGDGASFSYEDAGGHDPGAFGAGKTNPYEDIGAFRSQSLTSLDGKILRINPANGQGYPSNPYWDGNPSSIRSRVWAYGLRNPFRFCIEPGTGNPNPANGNPGIVHIGEVGYITWEELNIVTTPGMNFGWPCYEGLGPQPAYQATSPPPHDDCSSFGTSDNPAFQSSPVATWHHSDPSLSVPPGFIGNAAVGGVYYTGTLYPGQWRNRYFMGDYGQSWIKMFELDSNHQLVQIVDFADNADAPVDFALDPVTKDILYISITTNEIRRIRYTGIAGNSPPTAVASVTPDVGIMPLPVAFSSAGSFDVDGDPITYSWDFGDGQGSTAPNPSHTYTIPGTFDAVLTLSDGQGGIGRDTVRVIVAASATFPTTGVLDNFNRANGAIGGSWTGTTTGLSINANQLVSSGAAASTVWNGAVFGPDQEGYIKLNAVTATAQEHDLMLKVQGTAYTAGHIEVRWTAPLGQVQVSTYTSTTLWVNRGPPIPMTLAAGDQFGARAYSNGTIEVYKNGVKIGTTNAGDWPFAANGGRLGLTLDGASATRFDDFGGGNIVINPNTPPVGTILAPANNSFYATGDTIWLHGNASDGQDPIGALLFHWSVDLHHNNHIHPGIFVADGKDQYFIGENHDDGTGVWMRVFLQVTDTGALADTVSVDIHPEIDLEPTAVTTLPSTPGTTAPAQYRFRIVNHGRMPSALSRWRLVAGSTLLAEGDTIVAALDSVTIVRTLAPTLAAGTYSLRVVADTLGTVLETVETNNAKTRALTVVEGPGPDEFPPVFTIGPSATPGSVSADFAWGTSEPAAGVVRFGTTPALGDSFVAPAFRTTHGGSVGGLALGTKYYFTVIATDTLGNWAAAPLDSFTTSGTPLAVDDAPRTLMLGAARPNPSAGSVRFALELPRSARVRFSVIDITGREVWSSGDAERDAGRWTLEWPGTRADGTRAPAGLYFARVEADAAVWVRRFARLR